MGCCVVTMRGCELHGLLCGDREGGTGCMGYCVVTVEGGAGCMGNSNHSGAASYRINY